jgi:branched-chain amino acid transport system ATP-binding protein
MSLLKVSDIHVYIKSFYILQGVSFEIPKGETTVLMGRNGAGKTTAMRAILGLNPPKSGSILFNGYEISHLPAHKIVQKGIGYVPDTRRIFHTLTVEKNLILAMRKGHKSKEERFNEIFELFPDLKTFLGQKAGSLSGGQQQMLAVARALVNENQLLLVDEPTEGLSPILAKDVLRTLARIKEFVTILLVEQNFKAATAVGDNCYIMDNGKIVHGGRMEKLIGDEELITRYLGVRV